MTTLLDGDRLKLSSQVLTTGQAKHQLTVLSPVHLILKGSSSGQVVALPSALTLKTGWIYIITNSSAKPVIVRDFVGNQMGRLETDERLEVICLDNSSPKGDWLKSLFSVSHNPVSNCLFQMQFQGEGLAGNQWLSHHAAIDSKKVPAVIPFELCHLVGLGFSNSQDDVCASICLYKNGTTDLNLFQDFSVFHAKTQGLNFQNDLVFKKDDAVSVYLKGISNNGFIPENALVTLYLKIIKP